MSPQPGAHVLRANLHIRAPWPWPISQDDGEDEMKVLC